MLLTMENKEAGENSKQKDKKSSDNGRPLKKARYLWQVKGKYHLKENSLQNNSKDVANISDINLNECEENINVPSYNNEVNNKSVRMFSDRKCLEHIIAHTDEIMDYPEPDSPHRDIDKSISDEIPVTLVKPNQKADDFYLQKWQARQIAKGFVDNTINKVLESWMVIPFDVADFMENCENGGQVEDEGILMAIQSHGLRSSFPNIHRRWRHSNEEKTKDTHEFSSKYSSRCTCTQSRIQMTNDSVPLFHHRSNNILPYEYYESLCAIVDPQTSDRPVDVDPVEFKNNLLRNNNSSSYPKEPIKKEDNYEPLKMDDMDFLDAAVAVAIQKKGLTCG